MQLTKVEVGDVVVEGDAFGAAVFGQYVQDVALLAGREREQSPLFHADG